MATIPATNLRDAHEILDLIPLELDATGPVQEAAADPKLYTPLPVIEEEGRKKPGPIDRIRQRLLTEKDDTKLFLSGHIGSGKSTQINLLAAHEKIREAFSIVKLRFEQQEWPHLDSAQVLFRMAGAIFDYGSSNGLLSTSGRWSKILTALDQEIYGGSGILVKEGKVGLEFDLLFVRLKQELALSEARRKQFRKLSETRQSVLQDLLKALVDDVEEALTKKGRSRSILMLIDDLDKVSGEEAQNDIFDTNLTALLMPPFRALYTIPTGVAFEARRPELRQHLEHLYPVRVLKKSPGGFDPVKVAMPDRFEFFFSLLKHRVAPGLFDDESVRLAATYSGGVLRDFFHILRRAILIARYNELDVVDTITMRMALKDARLDESRGIYGPDLDALLYVHQNHKLKSADDRKYLNQSRVLECYNDAVWFEVNPLLWPLLEEKANDGTGT